jgi:cysteinyl-tRNA synthetase
MALAVVAAFAAAWPYRGDLARSVANGTMNRPLALAETWRYQLDKIDVEALAADPSDLLVIDYAKKDGKVPLTADEVTRIKVHPDGRRRLVVAYLSVGESEEYRYYWNPEWASSPPDWLGEENCAWPKAHRVRYWTSGWKNINYRAADSYLSRIISAGFDGVYLDRVDIFETYEKERPTARREMIEHVADLAAAARRLKPGFLVIPQNAETLLDDAGYRLVIDGLGKESLLHGGSETGKRNPNAGIRWSAGLLRQLQNDGKPVFVVEYLINARQIDRTAVELRQRHIVPAFETRALDGQDPTKPVDLKTEVGTPERTTKQCPPGTSW